MHDLTFAYENPLKIRLGEQFFSRIPARSGVYFFLDAQRRPLYIGKAENLRRRLASYKQAKPGRTADHILEMLEVAHDVVWEIHANGVEALSRETLLIRTTQPPFNIVGTASKLPFLAIGIKLGPRINSNLRRIDFRLTHQSLSPDFVTYGCFPQRGKTKCGYSALLRLLYISGRDSFRLHLPAKLCRMSPSYFCTMETPEDLVSPLDQFLRGSTRTLLQLLVQKLLAKDFLPKHFHAPITRDLKMVDDFFLSGPKRVRSLVKRDRHDRHFIYQHEMEKHFEGERVRLAETVIAAASRACAPSLPGGKSHLDDIRPIASIQR